MTRSTEGQSEREGENMDPHTIPPINNMLFKKSLTDTSVPNNDVFEQVGVRGHLRSPSPKCVSGGGGGRKGCGGGWVGMQASGWIRRGGYGVGIRDS